MAIGTAWVDGAWVDAGWQSGAWSSVTETVTLTEPDDLRVFQRVADGNADLTISGTYTGTPTAIEYRIVDHGTSNAVSGHNWQTLDASPSGGTFSGAVTDLQGGGWYNVDVRFSNATSITDEGANRFAVGALILCIGDSNSRRLFEDGTSYTQTQVGSQYTGSTNLGETIDVWAATAASGARELIDALVPTLGVPVGLIKEGIGSTTLTSQGDTGAGYWTDATANEPWDVTITDTDALGGSVECVIWVGGANDAFQGLVSEAQMETAFGTLRTQINADLTPGYTHSVMPLLISQTGRDSTGGRDDDGYTDIREAQRDYTNDTANTYLAAVEIDLPNGSGPHHSEAGYQSLGERLGNAYLDVLGLTATYPGPSWGTWSASSTTETVVTLTHGEGSDFTPTSGITGFRVLDDGTPTTISSAVRTTATSITLTHTAISGTRTVDYMYGDEPTTSGAVIDNSALTLPAPAMKSISQVTGGFIGDAWVDGAWVAASWQSGAWAVASSGGTTFNETIAEALSFVDAATRTAAFARTLSDALKLIDASSQTGGTEISVTSGGRSMTLAQMRRMERQQLLAILRQDDEVVVSLVSQILRRGRRLN